MLKMQTANLILAFIFKHFDLANITFFLKTNTIFTKKAFLCGMKQVFKYILIAILPLFSTSCHEIIDNPYINTYVNFEINLNQNDYYRLNYAGNYVYVTGGVESNSWGIILYRMPTNEPDFRAYDRFPPNNPYACQDENGNYKRLTTDGMFVIDSCNSILYNILDGTIIDGYGEYNLIQYHWSYNAGDNTLKVFN